MSVPRWIVAGLVLGALAVVIVDAIGLWGRRRLWPRIGAALLGLLALAWLTRRQVLRDVDTGVLDVVHGVQAWVGGD